MSPPERSAVPPSPGDREGVRLLDAFLRQQSHAAEVLGRECPGQAIDLYQGDLPALFTLLEVLMYHRLAPAQLDAVLRLGRQLPRLRDQADLTVETCQKIGTLLERLLFEQGQLGTFRSGLPQDRDGRPIPWITYPALEYLEQLDLKDQDVLEFGAGQSTLYWAARARSVHSIETEPEWHARLAAALPAGATLALAQDAAGVAAAIPAGARYGLILVDCLRHRAVAALAALPHLADGGLLVLDNSDWYPRTCTALRARGMDQIDFHGFGPINAYAWGTALFFRGGIRLPRKARPVIPTCGQAVLLEDDAPGHGDLP